MQNLSEFRLRAEDFEFVGRNLSRPECVLAEPDGSLWVSDNRGTATHIDPMGRQTLVGSMGGAPNGIAMDRQGMLYVANIDQGRVCRMTRDGRHESLLDGIDGRALGAANFVYLDARDRLWITVSTLTEPRARAVNNPIPDGYIVLMDEAGPRTVSEGLCFTNEIRIDAAGTQLYIAETARGGVSRQPLRADGSLGPRADYGPVPVFPGARIDGITLDAEGNIWATEITRNAIVVITPKGHARTVFEDPEGRTLVFPTSIAFGGPDLRLAYVGSLRMDRLACFRAPVPGAPMRHWR